MIRAARPDWPDKDPDVLLKIGKLKLIDPAMQLSADLPVDGGLKECGNAAVKHVERRCSSGMRSAQCVCQGTGALNMCR